MAYVLPKLNVRGLSIDRCHLGEPETGRRRRIPTEPLQLVDQRPALALGPRFVILINAELGQNQLLSVPTEARPREPI